jgi:hypothetical protein
MHVRGPPAADLELKQDQPAIAAEHSYKPPQS